MSPHDRNETDKFLGANPNVPDPDFHVLGIIPGYLKVYPKFFWER